MDCPNCQQPMIPGYLYSGFSVYWLYDSDGATKRRLGMGQRLQGQNLFKINGEKIVGWHCQACDSVLIDKAGLKPPA